MESYFSGQLAACDRVEVCMSLGRTAILGDCEQHPLAQVGLTCHAIAPYLRASISDEQITPARINSLQTQYDTAGSRQASDRSSSPDVKPLLQWSWSPLFGLLVDLCLTTRRPFNLLKSRWLGGNPLASSLIFQVE
jgi:hypothetical protein